MPNGKTPPTYFGAPMLMTPAQPPSIIDRNGYILKMYGGGQELKGTLTTSGKEDPKEQNQEPFKNIKFSKLTKKISKIDQKLQKFNTDSLE